MTCRITPAMCLLLALVTPTPSHGVHLTPDDSDRTTRIETVDYGAVISGRYAAVTLTLSLTAEARASGRIRLPLPPGSVLHEAAIWNPSVEQWAVAATLGRKAGQQVFESQPEEADRSPLLVQDIGGDLYRVRFHGLADGQPVRIRLRYAHLLEEGPAGFVLRVAMNNPDILATPSRGRLRVQAVVDDTWAPGGWRRGGEEIAVGDTDRSIDIANQPFDRDIELDLEPLGPIDVAGGLQYRPSTVPGGASEAVQRRMTPHTHLHWTPDLDSVELAPRRVVFVLDHSGSMNGRKKAEMVRGVKRALARLDANDQFGLVAFATRTQVFDSALRGRDAVDAAIAWLDAGRLSGGTNIFGGLAAAAALDDGDLDIYLITDGRVNSGPTTVGGILQALGADRRALRIFAFGIGGDLDQAILNDLVDRTDGEVGFALDDAEITSAVFDLFDRTRAGGVAQARIAVNTRMGRAVRRVMPGDTVEAAVVDIDPVRLMLEGEAGGQPYRSEVALPGIPAASEGVHEIAAPLVARVWARRIEHEIDTRGETDERIEAAILVARTYGIVTRYSSLLALPDTESYSARGISPLPRDAAGVALVDVVTEGDADGEERIGGAGAYDTPEPLDAWGNQAPTADAASAGCAVSSNRPVAPWWALMLCIVGLGLRRRRR